MDNLYYLLAGISVACYLAWLVATTLTAHYHQYKWLPYYGWTALFVGGAVAFGVFTAITGANL